MIKDRRHPTLKEVQDLIHQILDRNPNREWPTDHWEDIGNCWTLYMWREWRPNEDFPGALNLPDGEDITRYGKLYAYAQLYPHTGSGHIDVTKSIMIIDDVYLCTEKREIPTIPEIEP